MLSTARKILLKLPQRRRNSWEEAKAACEGYDAGLVNAFRVARSRRRVVDGSLLRKTLLPIAARLVDKPNLRVTDLGGATGDLGEDFLAEYPGGRYVVVENPTLIEMMNEIGRRSDFRTDMPEACDVFYSSGTLQYLDEPMAALAKGLRSAEHLAILVRNSFAEREWYHVQKSRLYDNGNGPVPTGFKDRLIKYAHRTLVEKEVLDLAADCGFACLANLEEGSGALHGQYGRQIVLMRIR